MKHLREVTLDGFTYREAVDGMWWCYSTNEPVVGTLFGAEALARIAELESALEAYRGQWATPTRKFREYKGIIYDATKGHYPWRRNGFGYATVHSMLYFRGELTDADHAAIYALKDNPFEDVASDEAITSFGKSEAA